MCQNFSQDWVAQLPSEGISLNVALMLNIWFKRWKLNLLSPKSILILPVLSQMHNSQKSFICTKLPTSNNSPLATTPHKVGLISDIEFPWQMSERAGISRLEMNSAAGATEFYARHGAKPQLDLTIMQFDSNSIARLARLWKIDLSYSFRLINICYDL